MINFSLRPNFGFKPSLKPKLDLNFGLTFGLKLNCIVTTFAYWLGFKPDFGLKLSLKLTFKR